MASQIAAAAAPGQGDVGTGNMIRPNIWTSQTLAGTESGRETSQLSSAIVSPSPCTSRAMAPGAAPIARRTPISRVRSINAWLMVEASPSPPITTVSCAIPSRKAATIRRWSSRTRRPALSVLIADDELVAREGLRRMLGAFEWVREVGEAGSGPAAAAANDSLRPDLAFLDVQMPGLLGTDLPARVEHQPYVVFTAAFAEHAVAAFELGALELGALDYLLRPFGPARLEADGDYVVAHAERGRHLMHLSLQRVERRLDPERFVRIPRRFVVNLDHVVAFRRLSRGRLVAEMRGGARLGVSRARAQELRGLAS